MLDGRWQSRRSWNGQALQRPLEKLVLARLLEERMRFQHAARASFTSRTVVPKSRLFFVSVGLRTETLAATMYNEPMGSYLHALRQRGKPFNVACMRKLLCIQNAMLRNGRPYNL